MKILSKNPLCFTITNKEIIANNVKLLPESYLRIKHRGVEEKDLLETIAFLENIKNTK